MPRAPSVCIVRGCTAPAPHGQSRCEPHRLAQQRQYNAGQASAAARGYDGKWRRFRRGYITAHPLCVVCGKLATDVDHIDGQGPLGPRGYDETNLQAMCRPCHARKTSHHDGGFGHAPRGTTAAPS